MERETIKFGDVEIEHNSFRWEVYSNIGYDAHDPEFGFIVGATATVRCGSAASLGIEEAKAVCREHNEWLSRQDPLDLEILKKRDYIEDVLVGLNEARNDVKHFEEKYALASTELEELTEKKNGTRND